VTVSPPTWSPSSWRSYRAHHQPDWPDEDAAEAACARLHSYPPLVFAGEARQLRSALAEVAEGRAFLLQAGDCAESFHDFSAITIREKLKIMLQMSAVMIYGSTTPVVKVGRIAGQFAKPRSSATEHVGGRELPVFRGHMINDPQPEFEARIPDPLRILSCYMAAREIFEQLGWHGPEYGPRPGTEPLVWTSHEALLLDYELPMMREHGGQRWLGSTHWPWIGERTRQVDGAHVTMLAGIANPVSCKVGPGMDTEEIVALCDRLDPQCEPGALTLIARMGAEQVAERLPSLVEAVRRAGHPVIWLCDPMHGNTIASPGGQKVRLLEAITHEIRQFRAAVDTGGGVAGGLHLETTPDEVTECVADASTVADAELRITSFCDPRLNPAQAVQVISAWSGAR
jgi:3-deoxy-7-phosphoheptulonate synthase